MAKVDVLVLGSLPAKTAAALPGIFNCHVAADHSHLDSALAGSAGTIRGIARGAHAAIDGKLIERLPKLEIISNFGVGYDGIDLRACAARGIVVTNTPDVLTEEVADTALGLLLMTVRELSAAERHVRAGKWPSGNYPLSRATLRNRTVGIAGLGRIGMAVARRLSAMQVPVVYHTRKPHPGASYRHYASLTEMAAAVDTLIAVLPGTPETRHVIGTAVLTALGPNGIFVNIGRGSTVDDAALIAALREKRILAAGLDVFTNEPNVPAELLALDNVVLLPHVGSASVDTRDAMGQLVIDNLKSWFEAGKPLTPVPETPWQPK